MEIISQSRLKYVYLKHVCIYTHTHIKWRSSNFTVHSNHLGCLLNYLKCRFPEPTLRDSQLSPGHGPSINTFTKQAPLGVLMWIQRTIPLLHCYTGSSDVKYRGLFIPTVFWIQMVENIFKKHPTCRMCSFKSQWVLVKLQVSPQKNIWLFGQITEVTDCYSVAKSYPILCDPMDCSTPGFPVLHYLLELGQTHVHWLSDAIQPSYPLSPPSPPALDLSQHQGQSYR